MKKSKYLFAGLMSSLCLAVFCRAFLAATSTQTVAQPRGKVIIDAYMASKGLHYRPGTKEYLMLMRGILIGEHPELTGEGSTFIEIEDDKDDIINYAVGYIDWGFNRLLRKYFQWLDRDHEFEYPIYEVELDKP